MKLAVGIVCAMAAISAAEPPPSPSPPPPSTLPHALVSLGTSVGLEDQNTTHTVDLTLAGRATPSLWGFATGRTGSSNHACGDCIGDGKLREGTVGVLFLPCRGVFCIGASGAIGYARREIYYPGGTNPLGETFGPSYELESWFVTEGRLRLVVHVADHIGLEGDVAIRYQRRLYDPSYPNAGGAVASIALGAWL